MSYEIEGVVERMRATFDNPIAVLVGLTKISRPTISKFFNNQTRLIKPSNRDTLYDACIGLIEEKEKERALRLLQRSKRIRISQSLKRPFQRDKTKND